MSMSNYFDQKELSFMAPKITEHGRHMVMTNVQPEIKTKFLNVDTRFQEEYNLRSNADVIIQLPQSIRDVKCLKITNVEIPATFFPFSISLKNTFMKIIKTETLIASPYTVTNFSYIIKIDDGNYTESSLITAINSKLSAILISSLINISYSTSTRKTTVQTITSGSSTSGPVNYDFTIYFAVDGLGNFDKYDLKSKLGWCLGFCEPQYTIKRGSNIISESFLNINTCRYLFVSVDDYQSNIPNTFIVPTIDSYLNSNILARVQLNPVSYTFGGIIVANEMDGKLLSDTRTYSGKNDIQKIRVQLLNEYGQVLNLNKMDFSFALMIQYI